MKNFERKKWFRFYYDVFSLLELNRTKFRKCTLDLCKQGQKDLFFPCSPPPPSRKEYGQMSLLPLRWTRQCKVSLFCARFDCISRRGFFIE